MFFRRHPYVDNAFAIEHHDTAINLHFHEGTLVMSRSELLSESQEFHIWDKVRRHQLAAQQDSKGLKELKICHSICRQSLTIYFLSSAYFTVQCVCVVSCLAIKRGRWHQTRHKGWFLPDRFFVLSTQFVSIHFQSQHKFPNLNKNTGSSVFLSKFPFFFL